MLGHILYRHLAKSLLTNLFYLYHKQECRLDQLQLYTKTKKNVSAFYYCRPLIRLIFSNLYKPFYKEITKSISH